jgi:tetratricopeptide (TPR) repeat protein
LEGLKGEESIAELCRREGISPNLYYTWSKEFLEAGKCRLMGDNIALTLLEIGRRMAEGELRYREGDHETAYALLREAVVLDVELRYDEPWGWMQPVRHALGALLLEQEHLKEAEAVYRADLALHPDNGWALHGLEETLRLQGKAADASQCGQDFQKAWSRSDIKLKASCFCADKARKG